MDKSRLKTMFILLRNSPEYVWALIIVTFFSIGAVIGEYIKTGGVL
jgi:ABC-type phosphate/phosphonate transport system permease subunit